jgi:16S rRNA (uracil1498-N3)-methyltransferase
MTRRRWIADEADLNARRAALTSSHAEHLARVLRAKPGQQFDLVIQSGNESYVYSATVVSVASSRVEFKLGELLAEEAAEIQITLLASIFKFDHFEWALEKAVELGVAEIVPVIARRTEKHLAGAAHKRAERWRRIAAQAAEQSRRSSPALVCDPLTLMEAAHNSTGSRMVLAEAGARQSLKKVLENFSANQITVAVGPEGGWTHDELDFFSSNGWELASLGKNVLRAETAIIAALAIIRAHSEN